MSRSKDIAFIATNMGYGGAQRSMAFVASAFLKDGYNVHIILLHSNEIAIPIDPLIKIHPLSQSEIVNSKKTNAIHKMRGRLRLIRRLRKELKIIKPQLACAFGIEMISMTKLSALGLPIKLVGSERRAPSKLPGFWKTLTRVFYGLCDGMVFQTHEAMDFYNKKIQKKSVIIPNPYIQPEREIVPFMGVRQKIIATAAARFEHWKGIDVLINAFDVVSKKYPEFQLFIYGEGHLLDEYKEQVRNLNLSDKVTFPGIVKDVAYAVRDYSAFILPSRIEGIPNVLLEVMAAGVPSVSCDCPPGGPALLTDNGRRALLVDVDDVNGMANAICQIIENANLSKQISKSSIEVKEIFASNVISKQWVDFFEKILDLR